MPAPHAPDEEEKYVTKTVSGKAGWPTAYIRIVSLSDPSFVYQILITKDLRSKSELYITHILEDYYSSDDIRNGFSRR